MTKTADDLNFAINLSNVLAALTQDGQGLTLGQVRVIKAELRKQGVDTV